MTSSHSLETFDRLLKSTTQTIEQGKLISQIRLHENSLRVDFPRLYEQFYEQEKKVFPKEAYQRLRTAALQKLIRHLDNL